MTLINIFKLALRARTAQGEPLGVTTAAVAGRPDTRGDGGLCDGGFYCKPQHHMRAAAQGAARDTGGASMDSGVREWVGEAIGTMEQWSDGSTCGRRGECPMSRRVDDEKVDESVGRWSDEAPKRRFDEKSNQGYGGGRRMGDPVK